MFLNFVNVPKVSRILGYLCFCNSAGGVYTHLHYGSEEGPTLWVGLSLTRGVRGGECPVIPPVHWKGVTLPRQRSSRTLKTLSNCKGFYRVFSAVERFLYLRDFLNYFCFIDFFIYVWEICNWQHVQMATCATGNTGNWPHVQLATHATGNMCNWQHVQLATCATGNMCNWKLAIPANDNMFEQIF